MASRTTTWTLMLPVLFTALTATALAAPGNSHLLLPHGFNSTTFKSRKRQEIIFLRDDFTHKRSREGETLANIEKHGKSLSAEGKVFKDAHKTDSYDDLDTYQGPALKEQAASKDKGPPEIHEEEKKSDAYEVVSEGHDSPDISSPSEYETPRIVKASHHRHRHRPRLHSMGRDSERFIGYHRSGLHIISLDGDDNDDRLLTNKDRRLYGSIGSPISMPVRTRGQHSYDSNDYIPPSVVPVSQNELSGPPRDDGESRDQIFPIFRRRDPLTFSQSSQLTQPEELMQPFRPLSPKALSVGDRPNMLWLPLYSYQSGSDPEVVPITSQNAFPASQPQLGTTPAQYTSTPANGALNNGLVLQSALQVPLLQSQYINPSFDPTPQFNGQFLLNSQQLDPRSLYQLQAQPQMQLTRVSIPQVSQAQPLIFPSQMQMTPTLLSAESQNFNRPPTQWVDEDGRERSEVLDRGKDKSDDDRSQDDQDVDDGDDDDDDEQGRHEGSRYYERDGDSPREVEYNDGSDRPPEYSRERSYSQDETGPSEEEGEDTDEPEEEYNERAGGRSFERNDAPAYGDQTTDSRSPDDRNDDDEGNPSNRNIFATRYPQQNSFLSMQSFMGPSRGFRFPRLPMPTSARMSAQSMASYQMAHPSSDPQGDNFRRPKVSTPTPNIPHGNDMNLKISPLSPAEAQFVENKAALEPNFTPPIASKDTIPGKSSKIRYGLQNVLIRLNGKDIEDSSQLRSKIVNGQIVQGQGKLIKSKGPVRVKLSHTKGPKHLKIIDIIAPKHFQVYDTKSSIRRPTNVLNGTKKVEESVVSKNLQKVLDNIT
ncbi:uncharacterized protein [Montipora capricornis]|uniref:uncharacterized protein n=1 Tax=Montipora capricornis TaxID=246305 RepID=UPI0035F1740C